MSLSTPKAMELAKGNGIDEAKSPLRIPDLFVPFLSQEPRPHPSYSRVRELSEQWFSGIFRLEDAERLKHWKLDIPYFIAIWTELASEDDFRTVVDWSNWIFRFDDVFDDEAEREDPGCAAREVEVVLNIMRGIHDSTQDPYENVTISGIRYLFQDSWNRFVKGSTLAVQQRMIKAMENYLHGVVRQVQLEAGSVEQDLSNVIELRRQSIGVAPCLPMIEFALKLDLPEEIFNTPLVHGVHDCVSELIFLQNDIVSYHKECKMGFTHNTVSLLRGQGLTQQQAYDRVDSLLRERYKRWYILLSEVPPYDERTDIEIRKYMNACEKIVLANVNWSFQSERYFGSASETVRRTRIVEPVDV